MDILFLSGTCSKKKYSQIFNERIKRFIDPSQKFFNLLLLGMCDNTCNIICLSSIPVSGKCHRKKIWRAETEIEDNIRYIYPGFINVSFLRFVTGFFTLLSNAIHLCKKNKGRILVYDPTDLRNSIIALLLKKVFGIKIVSIITDIPSLVTVIGHDQQSFIKRIIQKQYDFLADSLLHGVDGYVFLTDQMNQLVNVNNKPYIVIEGSVDSSVSQLDKQIKDKPRTIVYAGGVHEKFGVLKLIEAFILAKVDNCELRIFGAGQAVSQVITLSAKHSNVKYMGVVPLEQVVKEERRATLLVNPRPTNEEFTKFSFPSKTLEYMLSGTPLLTTRLAGIPKEYFEFLFSFDSENVQSMSNRIKEVMSFNDEELKIKGMAAFNFVKQYKNNTVQGNKIKNFLKQIL